MTPYKVEFMIPSFTITFFFTSKFGLELLFFVKKSRHKQNKKFIESNRSTNCITLMQN